MKDEDIERILGEAVSSSHFSNLNQALLSVLKTVSNMISYNREKHNDSHMLDEILSSYDERVGVLYDCFLRYIETSAVDRTESGSIRKTKNSNGYDDGCGFGKIAIDDSFGSIARIGEYQEISYRDDHVNQMFNKHRVNCMNINNHISILSFGCDDSTVISLSSNQGKTTERKRRDQCK